jgi:hypothetical protein
MIGQAFRLHKRQLPAKIAFTGATSPARTTMKLCLLFALLLAALLPGAGDPKDAPPAKPRSADYRQVRDKARAWFDRLNVDSVDLLKHGVKGKKKLAEILDVYLSFYRNGADAGDRKKILARVEVLIDQTRRREYHNLSTCGETEFTENSMSYLRVAWLMKLFGLDIQSYLSEVRVILPRLDEHLKRRGPWQRAMFGEYYDRFGLAKPEVLRAAPPLSEGVISRRVPVDRIDDNACYDLTHEVFVAFDYGFQKTQKVLVAADLAYAREVLPALIDRYRAKKNPDLLAELTSCVTYLGWHSDPRYLTGIDFLLDHQNPSGTWGDYEQYRSTYREYLEQQVYLHTTMVVMESLTEAFEGDWPAAR